jgi:hypothetical protein
MKATTEVNPVAMTASTNRFVNRGTEIELWPMASCVRSDIVCSLVAWAKGHGNRLGAPIYSPCLADSLHQRGKGEAILDATSHRAYGDGDVFSAEVARKLDTIFSSDVTTFIKSRYNFSFRWPVDGYVRKSLPIVLQFSDRRKGMFRVGRAIAGGLLLALPSMFGPATAAPAGLGFAHADAPSSITLTRGGRGGGGWGGGGGGRSWGGGGRGWSGGHGWGGHAFYGGRGFYRGYGHRHFRGGYFYGGGYPYYDDYYYDDYYYPDSSYCYYSRRYRARICPDY